MNKLILKTSVASICLGAFLAMTSCSNDSDEDQITDQVIEQEEITNKEVTDNLKAIEASDYVDRMVLDRSLGVQFPGRASNKTPDDCIKYEESDSGDSYSITYNDCDIYGDKINGKITVSYTEEENTVTSTITFEEFVYNDRSVNGTKSTSFKYDEENDTCSYTVTSDMTIKEGEDFTATIKGTKTTEGTYDDDYEHTTTTTGNWSTTINEDSYTLTIETPLVEKSSCYYYTVSGVLTITENDKTASIDYGDGTCDNIAVMTLPDGTTEEIEL